MKQNKTTDSITTKPNQTIAVFSSGKLKIGFFLEVAYCKNGFFFYSMVPCTQKNK
jgi:hypothetical protein